MATLQATHEGPDPRYHLVILPPPADRLTALLAARLANKLGGDRHRAKQWLLSRIPRVVKSYINSQQAQPECDEIRALGLSAFVARQEDLFAGPAPLLARRVAFEPGGPVFVDREANDIQLDSSKTYTVIKARRLVKPSRPGEHDPRTAAAIGLRDFGLGSSRLGFDPKVRVAGGRFDEEIETFLLIFDGRPMPLVEVGQTGMVYDWLGVDKARTAVANFAALSGKLQESLPNAAWDSQAMSFSLAPPGPLDRHRILSEMASLPLEQLTARLLVMALRTFPPAENPTP